jgi:hypothetical protein
MAKTVNCRDVGVDCDFVAKGETEEELLEMLMVYRWHAFYPNMGVFPELLQNPSLRLLYSQRRLHEGRPSALRLPSM